MTGIERHERDEKLALLQKLEREHLGFMQQIQSLRSELYPQIWPEQNMFPMAGIFGNLIGGAIGAIIGPLETR